jgi:hypothetical protein
MEKAISSTLNGQPRTVTTDPDRTRLARLTARFFDMAT